MCIRDSFIVLNNFITKYDETGRAMLFISFDNDLTFWDISLPKKYKEMYAKQIDELDLGVHYLPVGNCMNEDTRYSFFLEHASNLLDLIALTIPDMPGARIPDCFLNENGDLDKGLMRKISESSDFELKKNVPYSYEISEDFGVAYCCLLYTSPSPRD